MKPKLCKFCKKPMGMTKPNPNTPARPRKVCKHCKRNKDGKKFGSF